MIRDGESRRETFAVAVGALIAVVFAIFGPVQAIPPATGADGGPAGLTVGRLVPEDGEDITAGFQIRNRNSNLCLAAWPGGGDRPVIQSTCDEAVGLRWELITVDRSHHVYRLRSVLLGLCLVARGGGGTGAVATSCDYALGEHRADQHWRLGDRIENVGSHHCLAAPGLGESPAVATACNPGRPDQHWLQEPV